MVDTAFFLSEERFWLRKNSIFTKLTKVYVIALNYVIVENLLIAQPIGMIKQATNTFFITLVTIALEVYTEEYNTMPPMSLAVEILGF